jgi:sirohydrochlorin cobaltochelatase
LKTPASGPALILFAHGARDARWAEPFARIVTKVRAAVPRHRVELAYLEHLEPSLEQAARRLAKLGATSIVVVPLFLGRGGHLRVDAPRQVAAAQAGLPGVVIVIAPSAGEDEAVIEALAAYCTRTALAAANAAR